MEEEDPLRKAPIPSNPIINPRGPNRHLSQTGVIMSTSELEALNIVVPSNSEETVSETGEAAPEPDEPMSLGRQNSEPMIFSMSPVQPEEEPASVAARRESEVAGENTKAEDDDWADEETSSPGKARAREGPVKRRRKGVAKGKGNPKSSRKDDNSKGGAAEMTC